MTTKSSNHDNITNALQRQDVADHIRKEIDQMSKVTYPGMTMFGQNPTKRWPIYLTAPQITVILTALGTEMGER